MSTSKRSSVVTAIPYSSVIWHKYSQRLLAYRRGVQLSKDGVDINGLPHLDKNMVAEIKHNAITAALGSNDKKFHALKQHKRLFRRWINRTYGLNLTDDDLFDFLDSLIPCPLDFNPQEFDVDPVKCVATTTYEVHGVLK